VSTRKTSGRPDSRSGFDKTQVGITPSVFVLEISKIKCVIQGPVSPVSSQKNIYEHAKAAQGPASRLDHDQLVMSSLLVSRNRHERTSTDVALSISC